MCQVSLTYRGTVTQCLNFSSPYHGSWNLGGPGGWWLERVWLGFGNKQDLWEELFPCVYHTLFFFLLVLRVQLVISKHRAQKHTFSVPCSQWDLISQDILMPNGPFHYSGSWKFRQKSFVR